MRRIRKYKHWTKHDWLVTWYLERIKHLECGGVLESFVRTFSYKLPLGNEDNWRKKLMKAFDNWNWGRLDEIMQKLRLDILFVIMLSMVGMQLQVELWMKELKERKLVEKFASVYNWPLRTKGITLPYQLAKLATHWINFNSTIASVETFEGNRAKKT